MDKIFNPQAIEQQWYQTWEDNHYFSSAKRGDESYSIVLPPPNVTGSLHMGHGFQHTLMDTLIRYQRMMGKSVLWQAGVDHAGISTQMVVERRLMAQEQKTRHDLGREEFLKRVWEWKEESGGMICRQLRRMGSSIDWSRERFTMDPHFTEVVQDVFIKLFEEGLIYRGKKLVNWDPKLHTAISDLEVISTEEEGSLWHFRYPLADSKGFIVIATTRPETMLGDVAVAVHPDDERYKHLIGKEVKLPLTERTIPIIADEYVDPTFGTGCVKITPAHDFNDYAIGHRHHLPLINILTNDAKLNDNVPDAYKNLDRFEARKKIVADLQAQDLVEKIEKHTLKVPRGDRTNEVIEPYLTDQWFVKIAPLAKPAIEAVENNSIEFVPDNWAKTYFQWMHNIEDWCISRQLWWGHRIPAWHDESGNYYVGASEEDIRKKHQLSDTIKLTQDNDVLDTWFSAALWPFVTLGWPEKNPALEMYYPTDVLITGFDIIFFWVARMIMMALKLTGEVPFKQVYITGLIRDAEGHKMSKSKGNVLDPIDIIDGISLEDLLHKRTYGLMQPAMAEKISKQTREQFPNGISAFGTDALRFTFCALATTGRDIRFDLGRVEGYRNFCNKLWNAARFVLMQTEDKTIAGEDAPLSIQLADQWIIARLQQVITEYHHLIETYRFDLLAQLLYEFTWNEFCDWYLELAKLTLNDSTISDNDKAITRRVLLSSLETILRLLHPLMPFITEEIWQRIAPLLNLKGETIMLQPFPKIDDPINPKILEAFNWLQQIVVTIRTLRSEMQISPGKTIELQLKQGSKEDKTYFDEYENLILKLTKASSIQWLASDASTQGAAATVVGNLEIFIPLQGLIDLTAEKQRLEKEIEKINKDLEKVTQKLDNPDYVNKAPAAVVEKERGRLAELQNAHSKLQQQLELM